MFNTFALLSEDDFPLRLRHRRLSGFNRRNTERDFTAILAIPTIHDLAGTILKSTGDGRSSIRCATTGSRGESYITFDQTPTDDVHIVPSMCKTHSPDTSHLFAAAYYPLYNDGNAYPDIGINTGFENHIHCPSTEPFATPYDAFPLDFTEPIPETARHKRHRSSSSSSSPPSVTRSPSKLSSRTSPASQSSPLPIPSLPHVTPIADYYSSQTASVRSSHACNACRRRKVRCIEVHTTESNGTISKEKKCRRCAHMRLDCVWGEERKARGRKGSSSHACAYPLISDANEEVGPIGEDVLVSAMDEAKTVELNPDASCSVQGLANKASETPRSTAQLSSTLLWTIDTNTAFYPVQFDADCFSSPDMSPHPPLSPSSSSTTSQSSSAFSTPSSLSNWSSSALMDDLY